MNEFFASSLLNLGIPHSFDVLVVGSGAAGLYAALCLPEHFRVGLITKESLNTGASDWAQGGIAAAIDPRDSPQLHFEDTIKAGAGLCDLHAVKFLVDNAPAAIADLVALGVSFDRAGTELAMTLEAAHSRPRVLHAADTTGRAIVSTLTERVLEHSNIKVIPQAFALNLWQDPQTNRACGVSILYQNRLVWIQASAVILATGGGGQVFAQTTNPPVSTGDGVAIASRAGAILRDLEFFQFHPTALTKKGAPHFLISEAVRGEGAHLVDRRGERFAFKYHPQGELAPRDIVSRAIFSHLQETREDCVYLDFRPIEVEKIRHRFPNIINVCQQWGVDLFVEPIPVAPAAHYWMGGIAVDTMNLTSIPGLYAIGETASTGVHGANRLASNSLLECIVYAAQLAHLKIEPIAVSGNSAIMMVNDENWATEIAAIAEIREKLPLLVWQSAGICRTQKVLESAISQVEVWREYLVNSRIFQSLYRLLPSQSLEFSSINATEKLKTSLETFNLVEIAYLILKSASFRTESRGGHYRSDFPSPSPTWEFHTAIERERWWKIH